MIQAILVQSSRTVYHAAAKPNLWLDPGYVGPKTAQVVADHDDITHACLSGEDAVNARSSIPTNKLCRWKEIY